MWKLFYLFLLTCPAFLSSAGSDALLQKSVVLGVSDHATFLSPILQETKQQRKKKERKGEV